MNKLSAAPVIMKCQHHIVKLSVLELQTLTTVFEPQTQKDIFVSEPQTHDGTDPCQKSLHTMWDDMRPNVWELNSYV